MKRLIMLLVMIAFVTAPYFVFAEGEAETPPAETKILGGYDGGFVLRSADEQFKLNINGEIEPSYKFETKERNPDIDQNQDLFDNTFFVNTSKVIFQGNVYQKFSFFSRISFATNGTGTETDPTKPYWKAKTNVTYAFHPLFSVNVGQITMPMARDTSGVLINNALVSTQEDAANPDMTIARKPFGMGGSMGTVIKGGSGKFSYSLGVANGGADSAFNANNELSYSGRIQVDILDAANSDFDFAFSEKPQLSLGFGAAFEDDDAVDGDGDDSTTKDTDAELNYSSQMSTDIGFRWRGFSLTMEGFYRYTKVGDPHRAVVGTDGALTDVGYYIDMSVFIVPKKFAVGGRGSQMFREGPDNNSFEFAGGFMYCLVQDVVRWHVEYGYLLDYDEFLGSNDQASHRIQTKFAISF